MREPEVLHGEQVPRERARDPGPVATPRARLREVFELLVQPLEFMSGQAVNAVVEDALHADLSLPVAGGGRANSRTRRIASSCHGGACTSTASRSAPAASKNSPRRAFSSNARCWWLR